MVNSQNLRSRDRREARLGPTLRDWGRWVADGAIRGFIWLAGHGSRSITADAAWTSWTGGCCAGWPNVGFLSTI